MSGPAGDGAYPEGVTSWPGDAEDWSDEQWLAWLAETDAVPEHADGGPAGDVGLPSWRRKPLGTQMVAAAMVGLAEAIYGPRDKPAIVIDASGDPPGDGGLELSLDPDHPEQSVVVIRPWLLRQTEDDGS